MGPVLEREKLEINPNANRIKCGFGTLIHELKHFHAEVGADIDVEADHGYCNVIFPLHEEMQMDDDSVVDIQSKLIIKLSMYRLDGSDLEDQRNVLVAGLG